MIEASDRFRTELGRHNYVTPTSYLELLSAFKNLLEAKKADNIRARKRYTTGLEKLQGSAQQVGTQPHVHRTNCNKCLDTSLPYTTRSRTIEWATKCGRCDILHHRPCIFAGCIHAG